MKGDKEKLIFRGQFSRVTKLNINLCCIACIAYNNLPK